MIFVETLEVLAERIALPVALRNQHRQCVRKLHSGAEEELQHIVEGCAVAHARLDHGADVLIDAAQVVGLED